MVDLTTDSEQLAILLYQNVLPNALQASLQDCTKVAGANGVWDRLNSKYPANSILRAILQQMKDTKPMSLATAREMHHILEQIKDFEGHLKLADYAQELTCHSTLDLIEQKLTNNLVHNYRRWLLKEHHDKIASADLLVFFLQTETELEERLSTKTQTVNNAKSGSSAVHQINSDAIDCCVLCNKPRHRFVDCSIFCNYSRQEELLLCASTTDALLVLHLSIEHHQTAVIANDTPHVASHIILCLHAYHRALAKLKVPLV